MVLGFGSLRARQSGEAHKLQGCKIEGICVYGLSASGKL